MVEGASAVRAAVALSRPSPKQSSGATVTSLGGKGVSEGASEVEWTRVAYIRACAERAGPSVGGDSAALSWFSSLSKSHVQV